MEVSPVFLQFAPLGVTLPASWSVSGQLFDVFRATMGAGATERGRGESPVQVDEVFCMEDALRLDPFLADVGIFLRTMAYRPPVDVVAAIKELETVVEVATPGSTEAGLAESSLESLREGE